MLQFNINFKNLLTDALGTVWKTKSYDENYNLQWMYSLIKPLEELHLQGFIPHRDRVFYLKGHTAQILSLEHFLNDEFLLPFPVDTNFSIYISEGKRLERNYVFIKEEQQSPLNDSPFYLYIESEGVPHDVEFKMYNHPVAAYNNGYFIKEDEDSYVNTLNASIQIIRINEAWEADNIFGYGTSPLIVPQWFLSGISPLSPSSAYVSKNNYMYIKQDYRDFNTSFTINVPVFFSTNPENELRIRAIIELYRTAGFTYTINYY